MPKMRVYEIAKELNLNNKTILEKLPSLDITVKTHMSTLEENDVKKVKDYFSSPAKKSAEAPKTETPKNSFATTNIEVAKPEKKDGTRMQDKTNHDNTPATTPIAEKSEEAKIAKPEQSAAQTQQPQQAVSQEGRAPQSRPNQDRPYPPRTGADGKPYQPRPNQDGRPPYQPRLGPDGKPLPPRPYQPRLGPDGKPLPRTNSDGRPYQPRTGTDGRPPYQPRLGPDGKPLPPRPYQPRLGPDGKPLPRPNSDGRPYQPRTGTDGRPPYQSRPNDGRSSSRPYDKDKDSDRGGARPATRFQKDKPATPKVPQDKPDKFERQQKIEATKKIGKHERGVVDKKAEKFAPKPAPRPIEGPKEPKIIRVPALLTLKELAELMNKSGSELVKSLMKKGDMIGINEEITYEKAIEIAIEYNILVEEKVEIDILVEAFAEEPEDESLKVERPPVVVVMGHVDHGKTSLLDAIRKTDVVEGEAGGITQRIGAYTVAINGKPITFLDTPGHEAFTAMRMRGAQVTDIAILVVAADDGVMPQTIEAISHAKAAGVEIIVAINKIDKPSANPDRVMQELTEYGLVSEAWGGDTICVPVSAATKKGIDTLLEMVILVSELKEYRANPNKRARGTVIEALLDKGRGPVATILVQDGTLEIGDPIVAGTSYGKIRAMIDDKGRRLKKAGPSTPVEILGLSDVPTAGDLFHVAKNDKQARHVAESIFAKGRVKLIDETPQKVSLEDLFTQIQAGNIKELNIIIKADVQGSVEAVKTSLEKLSNDEVRIRTLLGSVGAITESDVMLASASNAIIIGFNVRPEAMAKSVADEQQVDIRLYRIIYNAIEDIQAAMNGMLDPIFEEKIIGHAEIRQIFKASGVGTIGGSYVLDGKITRNAKVRVMRDNIVVYEGTLDTLKRFKDDVKEVSTNYECGLLFNKFNDIREGDKVEAFVMEEIKR